ncbi:CLUMA_CG013702, isoform A [Clunio marinus]|uniref:CLUMA_CG013702, isoform A n=1 Tax=Clunio marinus TaxID=568069 RepID=A0A1J1ILJ4_9DIPT|nr:CLUMA_CG013702, isoform A [Clunio marinus]
MLEKRNVFSETAVSAQQKKAQKCCRKQEFITTLVNIKPQLQGCLLFCVILENFLLAKEFISSFCAVDTSETHFTYLFLLIT